MDGSVESCVTSTVVSHQKAIPFIMLTNDLAAPYRLSGEGPSTELINVQLKRVIIPLHAGDNSLYLRNHIQGLLCLPGCETTMLGRTRTSYPSPPSVPLDTLDTLAATTTTEPTARSGNVSGSSLTFHTVGPPPPPALRAPTPTKADFSRTNFFDPPTSTAAAHAKGAPVPPASPSAGPFVGEGLPPAPSATAPLVMVKGLPCALHMLRGGIRCQWGHHGRTAASTLFQRYLEGHSDLLRDADAGRKPPPLPALHAGEEEGMGVADLRRPRRGGARLSEPSFRSKCDLRGDPDPDASCLSLMSSSTLSASVSVNTEDLREVEESEALHGQTLNYVSDYVPVSCPPPPPGVAATLSTKVFSSIGGAADPEEAKHSSLVGSQPNEEMFTCWASNSCTNMPIFTLPLTGFALVAVSTHMVRRACLNPNATEDELDKICDEFLCDINELPEMPSAQQRKIYEDGMKLMVAASFLQI